MILWWICYHHDTHYFSSFNRNVQKTWLCWSTTLMISSIDDSIKITTNIEQDDDVNLNGHRACDYQIKLPKFFFSNKITWKCYNNEKNILIKESLNHIKHTSQYKLKKQLQAIIIITTTTTFCITEYNGQSNPHQQM